MSIDTIAASAVDLARAAAVQEAGDDRVGEHVEVVAEEPRVVTHLFECTDSSYRGWRWSVTLARAARARTATVDEVVLVAGPDSIVAPEWVTFAERLTAGDLGVGDVIPTDPDDDRLVPGRIDGDIQTALDPTAQWRLDLGRSRVLSAEGRDEAAERWAAGARGPGSAMAKQAAGSCSTCGFMVPLAGSLGSAFGVCANELSPSDGQVVAMDFGCGAHSEAIVVHAAPTADVVLDETGYDPLDLTAELADEGPDAQATDGAAPEATAKSPDPQAADESPDAEATDEGPDAQATDGAAPEAVEPSETAQKPETTDQEAP